MATQMLRRLPPAPGGAPLRREPRRCIRTVVTAAGGTHNTNDVVRVCTHTTCRKQGSRDVVGFFGEVVDHSRVTVKAGGCLGNCGSGPNVVFLPEGAHSRCSSLGLRTALVGECAVGGGTWVAQPQSDIACSGGQARQPEGGSRCATRAVSSGHVC